MTYEPFTAKCVIKILLLFTRLADYDYNCEVCNNDLSYASVCNKAIKVHWLKVT